MFGTYVHDPVKRLEQEVAEKLLEARNAQLAGKPRRYAKLMDAIDILSAELAEARSAIAG